MILDNYDTGSYNCGQRSHIELGPLPEKTICGTLEENRQNLVYTSKKNHLWIKFVRDENMLNNGAYFSLSYIGKFLLSCIARKPVSMVSDQI